MGTSLCDVKTQRKIANIFFHKQDTFSTMIHFLQENVCSFSTRKCMFDTFTKNAQKITQRPTLYVLSLVFKSLISGLTLKFINSCSYQIVEYTPKQQYNKTCTEPERKREK